MALGMAAERGLCTQAERWELDSFNVAVGSQSRERPEYTLDFKHPCVCVACLLVARNASSWGVYTHQMPCAK